MKWIFLFLLTPFLLQAADEQVAWSPPVKGLRARLFISPNRDPEFDYSYQVYVQFENVGVVGNLGMIREERRFQCSEMGLALDVTNASGQKLSPKPLRTIEVLSHSWNLCLPWGGNLAFPIGHASGAGPKYLQITPFLSWDLPATGTETYYLSGTFSTKFPRPNPPRDLNVRLNWEGTLVLPPIKVPAQ